MHRSLRLLLAAFASGAAHATGAALLPSTPAPRVPRTFTEVNLTPLPPRPEPQPLPPPPETQADPAPRPTLKLPAPKPETNPEPAAPQPAPVEQAAAPVRLIGVQLSNADWSLSGQAGEGARSASRSTVAVALRQPPPPVPALKSAPPFVAVGNLSRKPTSPTLDAALRQNYPPTMRLQGVEGTALLKLRLAPSGEVVRAEVVSASNEAFAAACRKTLLGTQWSAPRDHGGNAVATELAYRCQFRVDS